MRETTNVGMPLARCVSFFVLVTLVLVASCSDAPIIAPRGSKIEMAVAPTVLAADGDTATVSIYVTESDGSYVENGTRVVLSATGGTLCPLPARYPASSPSCAPNAGLPWPAIVELRTESGIASAIVRAGPAIGTLALQARSGAVVATASVTVSGAVAAAGSKLVLQADPEKVAIGATTVITAFLSTAENAAVPDGTRLVFAAGADSLSRQIVLTRAGFARTTLTKKSSAATEVTATSGTVTAKVTVAAP